MNNCDGLAVRLTLILNMGLYSIKELEQLSGIKAHTIRIWEQRYKLLNPTRTDTNIRTYNDEELRHLLNISLLVNHGYKISAISKLSRPDVRSELNALLFESNVSSLPLGDRINGLILAMMEMDEYRFKEIFDSAKQQMSFEVLVKDLFYPFLHKVGLMWGFEEVNPAQEHFVSNLIRRKIMSEIDKLPLAPPDKPNFLLFLKEGELHEIGLMFSDFILRLNGYRTTYLGPNVPMVDVIESVKLSRAAAILTFMVKPLGSDKISEFLTDLSARTSVPVYFNAAEIVMISESAGNKIIQLKNIPDLKEKLSQFKA